MGKYDLKGIRDEASQDQEQAPSIATPAQAGRVGVREPGKRSNPEFSRTTIYMRDTTKLKATRLLQDRKEDRDLSQLIEDLVSGWASGSSNI